MITGNYRFSYADSVQNPVRAFCRRIHPHHKHHCKCFSRVRHQPRSFELPLPLSLNLLYANNTTADTEEMKKVFPLNDSVVENSKCEWKCRKVNDGYATQIIGFDFANGTTFCKVYEISDLNLDLKRQVHMY